MIHKDYWDGFQAGCNAGYADGFDKGMRFVSSANCKAGYGPQCRGGGLAFSPQPERRRPPRKEAVILDAITPQRAPSVPKVDLTPNLEPVPPALVPLGPKPDPIFSTSVQGTEKFRPVAS